MITRESTRLVREPRPFRDGVGYRLGLNAAADYRADARRHRAADDAISRAVRASFDAGAESSMGRRARTRVVAVGVLSTSPKFN